MNPSVNAENLVAEFEGLRTTAYLDLRGIPTIGHGHTAGVKMGDMCTEEQAGHWLLDDLGIAAEAIDSTGVQLTQNQFDALCSLTYNVGVGAFLKSIMLQKLKAGDFTGASLEFLDWDKATINGIKVVVPGLLRRRMAEQALFLKES